MIEIYDSATRGFRGLTVYGNTRQNLWVNPDTSKNSISATPNADGSVKVSGTPTSGSNLHSVSSFVLRPGSTYYLSCNPAPSGFNVGIFQYVDGSFKSTKAMPNGGGAVTIDSDVDYVTFVLYGFTVGTPYSGTYRVMLNEGSEPAPWCPPGLSSVDELSVVTAGKNLLDIPDTQTIEAYGGPYTFTMDDDGWVSCSKDSDQRAWGYKESNVKITLPPGSYTASIYFSDASTSQGLQIYTEDGTRILHIAGGLVEASQSFSLDAAIEAGVMYKLAGARARVQLELGSTATAYEPPAVTYTPIDLDGHTLNALPDGTRDELRIDGTGVVTLVQRVGAKALPGDAASWNLDASSPALRYSTGISPNAPSVYAVGTAMCDALPPRNATDGGFNSTSIIAANAVAIAMIGTGETAQDIASACGGKTLLYKLAAPQVIDLPPVEVPQFKRKKQTIIYAVANVPAEIKIDYLRWSTYADGFAVDGVHSFRDMGCCVAASDSGSPSKKLITKTVPHMSGFYDFSKVYGALAYESREVTYRFDLIGDDMQEQKSRLLNWLGTVHDADIFDDLIEGYHFRGSYSSAEWEEGEESESGSLTVTFLCHPFLIADAETVVQLKDGDNDITLEGFAVNPYASAENTATVTIGGAAQSVGTSPIRLSTQLKTGANIVNVTGAPVTLRWREQRL